MEIIRNILIAGTGSFIGGAVRYILIEAMSGVKRGWPTVVVNLVGCLLIGLIWGLLSRIQSENSSLALFLMVGICGGFTTFSSFSKDALMMLQSGNISGFAAYICTSVIAGIALTALGYYLTRQTC